MTATPVSICSNALLMLGDSPIASFDEGTNRARLASNLWPHLRDAVLRRHPWNCATKRIDLGPDATAPAFDYTHQFTLPGDYLRALQVGERGERPDYKIESGKLLMNGNRLLLRYIWRNEVTQTWDALLVHAMTRVMRAAFAYSTTQSTSLEAQIEQVLREVLREARAVDGQEDTGDALDDSPLLAARYSTSGVSRYRGGA